MPISSKTRSGPNIPAAAMGAIVKGPFWFRGNGDRPMGLWACGLSRNERNGRRRNRVRLHQGLLPQHGVLQHHGIQGHSGGPHVPLGCGLTMHWPLEGCLRFRKHYPQVQKHMWYIMMTLYPMVLEGHIGGFILHSEVTQYIWSSLKEAHRPTHPPWLSFELC